MKSLIAEDDPTSSLVLQKLLGRFGEVHATVNGREAIEAWISAYDARQPYDLVCLDVMMPVTNGIAALRWIRATERRRRVPTDMTAKIVMTTSVNAREEVLEAVRAGCSGYALKPIDRAQFLDKLVALGLTAASVSASGAQMTVR